MSESTVQTIHILNNPAARLADLIEELAKVGGDIKTVEAWAKVFGLGPNSPQVLVRIAEVQVLFDEALRRASRIDPKAHSRAAKPVQNLRTALAPHHVHNKFNGVRGHFENGGALAGLQALAAILDRQSRASISSETLKEARSKTEELQEIIEQWESGPEDFRAILMKMIARLKQALDDYRIEGPEAIVDATIWTAGLEELNNKALEEATSKDPKAKDLLERVKGITRDLGRQTLVAALIEGTKTLLLGP